jgi:FkbM family methyltransferase
MKDQMSNKLPELIDPELVNQVSWTIFAFEANPVFDKDLYRMKQKLSKKHKVNLYNSTAAWIYNGYINFYLDLVNKKDSYWGSSLDNNHPDVVRSGKTKVNVSCVDIAELLLENFNENDFIVVKIDIEGAEYDLLVDFIKKNVLKLIDYIGIEYHNNLLKFNSPNQVFNYILQSNGIKLLKWV